MNHPLGIRYIPTKSSGNTNNNRTDAWRSTEAPHEPTAWPLGQQRETVKDQNPTQTSVSIFMNMRLFLFSKHHNWLHLWLWKSLWTLTGPLWKQPQDPERTRTLLMEKRWIKAAASSSPVWQEHLRNSREVSTNTQETATHWDRNWTTWAEPVHSGEFVFSPSPELALSSSSHPYYQAVA